jgi:hypothetical protein
MQYNEEKEIVYTEEEAANYIAMSRSFLRQDRMNGYRDHRTLGPHFVKNGRAIRYLKRDLDEWLYNNRIVRTRPIY